MFVGMFRSTLTDVQKASILTLTKVHELSETYRDSDVSVCFSTCSSGIPTGHTSQKRGKRRRGNAPLLDGDQWNLWSTVTRKDPGMLGILAGILAVDTSKIVSISFMRFIGDQPIGWHCDEAWVGSQFVGMNCSDYGYALHVRDPALPEDVTEYEIKPWSVYVMCGDIRSKLQHMVPIHDMASRVFIRVGLVKADVFCGHNKKSLLPTYTL